MNGGDPYQPRKTSGLAITALVLSCLFFLPLIPLIGAVLGIVALVRLIDRPQLGGKGLAIAAIPVGLVVTLFLQGIMAAIAIPAFIRYTRKAKSVEATEQLDRIRLGATSAARETGVFPTAETGWIPDTPCCEQTGRKCAPDPGAWQATPWKQLAFAVQDAHYFQYRYSGGGRRFEAEARGDLDCDGVYSSYRIEGSIGADGRPEVRGPIIADEIE